MAAHIDFFCLQENSQWLVPWGAQGPGGVVSQTRELSPSAALTAESQGAALRVFPGQDGSFSLTGILLTNRLSTNDISHKLNEYKFGMSTSCLWV